MDPELGKLRAGSGINHSGSTTLLFRHSSHCPVEDITVGNSPKSIPSFSDKFLWCRQIQNDSHRPRGLQPPHHPFHLGPIGQLLLGGAPPQNPSPANPQSRRFSVPVNQSSSTHSRSPNPLVLPPPTGHSPPSSLPPCPHPPPPQAKRFIGDTSDFAVLDLFAGNQYQNSLPGSLRQSLPTGSRYFGKNNC